MRTLACAVTAVATLLAASPARAQTYDPRFPVCMHVFGGETGSGDYFDCTFTSLPQCRATASGLAAQCVTNPYFVQATEPPDRAPRRHRRSYQRACRVGDFCWPRAAAKIGAMPAAAALACWPPRRPR